MRHFLSTYRNVLVPPATIALSLAASFAQTNDCPSVHYVLLGDSTYQSGCFDPCDCPLLEPQPMTGTFDLRFLPTASPIDTLAVDNVAFGVEAPQRSIVGSGFFRFAGQFNAMSLDLSIDGEPAQAFDSGWTPTDARFPEIDVVVTMNQMVCYDVVLHVHALPAQPYSPALAVDRDALDWTPWPVEGFDVVCGDLVYLRGSGGDFAGSAGVCLGSDYPGFELPYDVEPDAGGAAWFLVRDAEGSYDAGAGAPAAPRDVQIESSALDCP